MAISWYQTGRPKGTPHAACTADAGKPACFQTATLVEDVLKQQVHWQQALATRRTCISTSATVVRLPAKGTYEPAPISNSSSGTLHGARARGATHSWLRLQVQVGAAICSRGVSLQGGSSMLFALHRDGHAATPCSRALKSVHSAPATKSMHTASPRNAPDGGGVALQHLAAQRSCVPQRHRQPQAHALAVVLPCKLHLVRPAAAVAGRVATGQG